MAIKSFYSRFQLYFFNTSWLIAEKVLNMGMSFLVTVLVSRYLGPQRFGTLAYAISLTGLFTAAGHMGLSGLVVREIVKNPQDRPETLGTSFALKTFGILIGFIVLILIAFLTEEQGSTEFWVLVIVSMSMLFQPFNIIDYWFQAHVQVKYTTIARMIGFFVYNCLKIALVIASAKLLLFAFANLIQSAITALLLILLYQFKANISIKSWFASVDKAKELLGQGWIIYLGSIFAVVYLKIDQIMIKWLIGSEEVGLYSVAATLSEVWYFVPTAIVASLFPRLIQLRESDQNRYKARLQQIFDLLFVVAFFIAICVAFLAKPLISLTFGQAYLKSAGILTLHVWAGLFIFMRAVFSKWILIEDAIMLSFLTQGFGAASNVVLNLVLIPDFGVYGAATATLISYAIASYLALFASRKSRSIFWMMTHSILLVPTLGWRYWKKYLLSN